MGQDHDTFTQLLRVHLSRFVKGAYTPAVATTVRISGARAAGQRVKQTMDSFVTKQAQFAGRQTINALAYGAREHLTKFWIPNVYDRPIPQTRTATRYTRADKTKAVASVFIDNFELSDTAVGGRGRTTGKKKIPPSYWMRYGIYGGGRVTKAFERLLQSKGILPPGMFVVPGSGATLDAFGNIPGSLINLVIAYFGGFGRFAGDMNNLGERRRKMLIGERLAGTRIRRKDLTLKRPGMADVRPVLNAKGFPTIPKTTQLGYRLKSGQIVGRLVVGGQPGRAKGLKPGIYVATGVAGQNLKCLMKFVRQPIYRKIFPFHTAVEQYVMENAQKVFEEQFERAILFAKSASPTPTIQVSK